ncbi:hypothetical protein pb186bvf_014020 [Paramecium bursaria]
MNYFIIAFFYLSASSLSISNFSTCNCTQYTTQNDCSSGKCSWSNTCGPFNCTAVLSYHTCIDQNTCAWVKNSCAYFTQCSDYSSNSNTTCEVQGQNCFTTQTVNGTGFSCAQIVQNYMVIAPTFDCSTLTQSTCTNNKYCMFMNNVCMSLTCGMSTQSQCTYTFLGDYRVMTLCQWTGSKCQDASDTKFLTQETCFSNTQGYYYWDTNSSSCKSCSGYSSGQIIIMSLILIFI